MPNPEGRPSLYTPELVATICAELAEGYSLRTICKRDEMPGMSTVMAWLKKHPEFQEQYARAREAQADAYAEDIIDIADDSGFDAKIVDGRVVLDGEAVNRARLRVDARKWYAGKIAPKKYGDKLAIGGDPDAPPVNVVHKIERVIVKNAQN